ncbi:hypothetical protein PR202_ga13689 [Eleusine coracana subsp. coracana]|uniref:Uncharacterized protein n=1 Tax=Eleusine coracana subsp. coracana TaxID=191504 RepID=A0AAV5CEQ1_ELECO|nr:hypothetical protein PR202_ga13689 [Eleusine coracana subsp. coracana]
MASKMMLGRIQSIGGLSARLFSHGEGLIRPLQLASSRPFSSAICPLLEMDVQDQEPLLDRFADPRVAHEDRQFIQLLDRMLDAIGNPQRLAQMQHGRFPNGLKVLDDDL